MHSLRLAPPANSNSSFTMSAASTALPSSFSSFHSNGPLPSRCFRFNNPCRSRVFMSVSVGSQNVVDDTLFADYRPTSAFLFPGQGAQAVGMVKEGQNVPAAAELYKKANNISGYTEI
ncbi:uncharacterized protein LOC120185733 [Hibiscus syriacus]|uniref:uncharacterized protein LOC120185733 n=1 Tax=Hibiscus syriacus TaxID=106335 RepID=UPI001920DBB4|nr:uncharacterized protein LOC120185733 [Hibiscus syriacus]